MSFILNSALMVTAFQPRDLSVSQTTPVVVNLYSPARFSCRTSASDADLSVYQSILNDLASINGLTDGWYGEGSLRVKEEVIARAKMAATIISQVRGLHSPEVYPNPQGTVSLEWERDNLSIYVEIGKTRITGFVSFKGQTPHVIPDGPLDYDLFASVKELLSPSIGVGFSQGSNVSPASASIAA